MSFIVYDLIFLVLFILVVGIFLYRHRARAKWEGILLLYRTQVGIKFIDYVDLHYGKYISKLKWLIIVTGYISMAVMSFLLLQLLYVFIKAPEVVRAVKIPPLAPLIPYLPELFNVDFLPPFYFTYWILAIAVIALSHEFAHGIFAKINHVRVKSTGFGFLGPFLAAFVEPDEEEMQKIKKSDQLAILGAGSFANLIMTVIFLALLWGFFALSFSQAGFIFNTYAFTVFNISDIDSVGGVSTANLSLSFILASDHRDGSQDKKLEGHNFTTALIDDKLYYIDVDITREHLKENLTKTIIYENAPALQAGLNGVIVEVDGQKVRNHNDLKEIFSTKNPGDKITVLTEVDKERQTYDIVLGKHSETGKPYLGIATFSNGRGFLLGKIKKAAVFFKDPNTYYKPRFNHGFIVFIYDLLWWIVLINISVALVNMLPLGIFDGGRVFFVTLLGIFKSEKAAKRGYKIATNILLLIFLLLMVVWFVAMF